MTGQLPQFSLAPQPPAKVIEESNSIRSAVFIMIETQSGVENIDDIAATPELEVFLIGSKDLSIELGVPGQFESREFRSALERVRLAAKRHAKILGLAGIYDRPDLQDWAVNTLGVRFILGQQDSGLISSGAKRCMAALNGIELRK
jgi:2-keto-3-deoxy-L-rhamnonate aldolase RhmA